MGQAIAGYSRGGCLLAAVVGFIGAFLGQWLGRQLGLPEIFPVTVGAKHLLSSGPLLPQHSLVLCLVC